MRRAATVSSLLVASCAFSSVFYQYEGPPKAAQDEAVLFIAEGDTITVKELDGKELNKDLTAWKGARPVEGYFAVREIHMSPGRHSIYGGAAKAGAHTVYRLSQEFASGKKYRIVVTLVGYGLQVGLEEAPTQ